MHQTHHFSFSLNLISGIYFRKLISFGTGIPPSSVSLQQQGKQTAMIVISLAKYKTPHIYSQQSNLALPLGSFNENITNVLMIPRRERRSESSNVLPIYPGKLFH